MISFAEPVTKISGPVTPSSDEDLLQIKDLLWCTRFLIRHSLRLIGCVTLALGLGCLYLQRAPTIYQSQAALLVEFREPLGIAGAPAPKAVDAELPATHLLLIESPWFADLAMQQHDLARLKTFAGTSSPENALINSLDVSHRNSVFKFTVQSEYQQDCPRIVDAVLATYQSYLYESQHELNKNIIELISQKAAATEREMRQREQQLQQLQESSPLESLESIELAASVHERADLGSKRVDLMIRRAEVESRLAAVEEALKTSLDAAMQLVPASLREQQLLFSSTEIRQQERREDRVERAVTRAEDKLETYLQMLQDASARYQTLQENLDARLLPLLTEEKQYQTSFGSEYPRMQELRTKISLTRAMFVEPMQAVETEIVKLQTLIAGLSSPLDPADRRSALVTVPPIRPPSNSKIAPPNRDRYGKDRLGPDQLGQDQLGQDQLGQDQLGQGKSRVGTAAISSDELLSIHVRSLQQELQDITAADERLDAKLQSLHQKLADQQEVMRETSLYELNRQHLETDIARAKRTHETLINQLSQFDLRNDTGTFRTTIISPASSARQIAPQPVLLLAMASMIGLACGLTWAGWLEIFARTFRDPESVRQLGLPVLGQVPLLGKPKRREKKLGISPVDPILCTYRQPESANAEAYRSLRTAVYCSNQGLSNLVIQITSPASGDGKSTLAANLAVSIAQSTKRVLLIDADLRQAAVHRIFHCDGDIGLSTLLSGQCDLSAAIHPSAVPGLCLLPAGKLPESPADLLASPRFSKLLGALSEKFDFVLIDTPPLLAASEARMIAAIADGVVLTVRPIRNDHVQARYAREVLEMVGANVLGVVLNASRSSTHQPYGCYWSRPLASGLFPAAHTPRGFHTQ